VLLGDVAHVEAGQFQKVTSNGQVRIHYPASSPASCDVITIGVGTAMSDNDYDNLAGQLNSFGYIVAVMDHQPGNLTKTDATKYKNLANDIKANLLTWLSGSGVSCNSVAHWIMGGHSAGGQAAHNAVSDNPGLADAMFNIDPFDISGAGNISVPTLNWGLDTTTCFVDKNKAAKAAYYKSTGKRAFVRINVPYGFNWCGYSPKYFHCSFTDGTCPACTNCAYPPSSFYTEVATSVNKFINAAFYGTWSKANLSFSSNVPKTIFEGADAP
jgi:hypothetical protein